MSTTSTFNEPVLRQLAATGKTGQFVGRGVTGGFILVMREGKLEQTLVTQRGGARVFKRLETLASYLVELGIHRVALELENWRAQ